MGFIRYPDIVPATAEITAINPPASIVAKINGKIDNILVENGENTEKNNVLAILQSSAKWDNIITVEKYISLLDSIQQVSNFTALPSPLLFSDNLALGELQGNYAEVKINYTAFYSFLTSGLYEEQSKNLSTRIKAQTNLLDRLRSKKKLQTEQYRLVKKDFERDSIIHLKNGISDNQYERQYQNLLQAKSLLVDMDITMENTAFSIEQYRSELSKTTLQYESDRQAHIGKLTQTIQLLKTQLAVWKQNYLIVSPVAGIVSFNSYWSKNQNVKTGEVVFSVVPPDTSSVKVRLLFPVVNSGKVEIGQRVNIKLHNYPYQEFGMLVGSVENISEVPNNDMYSADVALKNKLTTSYQKSIPKVQDLKGDAEILTDDISLLLRLFNPLRALFDDKIRTKNEE